MRRVWPTVPLPAFALVALIAVLAPLGAADAVPLGTGCPASTMDLHGVHRETAAATDDTLFNDPVHPDDQYGGWFDLTADSLRAYASAAVACASVPDPAATVVIRERYRFVGVPAGTPVEFRLRMPMTAYVTEYPGVPQGYGALEFALAVDGMTLATFPLRSYCCHLNASESLAVNVTRPAGNWFEVAASVTAHGCERGSCAMGAGLHFDRLPAGVTVVACHGDSAGSLLWAPPLAAPGRLRIESVRPNPARGPIEVRFGTPGTGRVIVELVDVAGRIVERRMFDAPAAGVFAVGIGESNRVAAGAYVVRLRRGAETGSRVVTVLR